MRDITIRHLDMGRRVTDFMDTNNAAFPAGSRASELITAIGAAVAALETESAKQDTAEQSGKQATDQKDAARAALLDLMRPINQTARGMEKLFPGIGVNFGMPRGGGDQPVINRARSFVTTGTPIAAQFVKRGLPADFLTTLETAINRMISTIDLQAESRGQQIAATAAVALAQQQLVDAVHEFSPIVRNVFHDDKATLAAWESASHVERAPKRAAKKTSAPKP